MTMYKIHKLHQYNAESRPRI